MEDISRREFIEMVGAGAAAIGAGGTMLAAGGCEGIAQRGAASKAKKAGGPNILLITSDQQHFMALGINNPEVKTPNLDRLAAQGTMFDRAYTVNPTCTPTRASIITGKYPSQHGAYALGTKLPESERTVGQYFSEAGYKTALVGKAHFQPLAGTEKYPSLEAYPILQDLDFWRKFHGPFYGFDHVELARNHTDEAHVGQHYAIWMEEKGAKNWRDWFSKPTGNMRPQHFTWNIPEEYHYDTWIAERTNALMEQYKKEGESFFLWASFFDPHPSYLVPAPWDKMYDPAKMTVPKVTPGEHDNDPLPIKLTQERRPDFSAWSEPDGNFCHGFHSHLYSDEKWMARNIATYYGMVSMLDKYVGKILDKLDELGLADNTLVVFTTDHGHYYGQHGLIAKGSFHYDDGIKVPFIARMPGRIGAGKRNEELISLVDIAPTFLSVAGLEIPREMTGVDQKAVFFEGAKPRRDHVIVENHMQPTKLYNKSYINERYKMTVWMGAEYGELYDLQEDPGEIRNLWDDAASATLKSELMLKMLHADMGKEPVWMPRVAGA